MAKYTGMFPYRGTIGGVTCCETKNGIILKQKSSLNKERIMKDARFSRTRENIAEFSTSAKSNKLIRQAVMGLRWAKDPSLLGRLTREVMAAIKQDPINPRGARNLQDGPAEMLKGFNLNERAKLENKFHLHQDVTIKRKSGVVMISLPLFEPLYAISAPDGATHYRLVTAVSEIDFKSEWRETSCKETEMLVLDNNPVLPMSRSHTIPKNTRQIIFVFLGIQFFRKQNEEFAPVSGGSGDPLCIIEVSKG